MARIYGRMIVSQWTHRSLNIHTVVAAYTMQTMQLTHLDDCWSRDTNASERSNNVLPQAKLTKLSHQSPLKCWVLHTLSTPNFSHRYLQSTVILMLDLLYLSSGFDHNLLKSPHRSVLQDGLLYSERARSHLQCRPQTRKKQPACEAH